MSRNVLPTDQGDTEGAMTLTAAPVAQIVLIETTWQDHVTAFVARYQSANTRKPTIQDLRTLFITPARLSAASPKTT